MSTPRIVPTSVLGGIAGKDGSNVLPTDTAVGQALGDRGLPTNGDELAAAYVSMVVITGPGIDPTGATDSTAAIQAKLNSIGGRGGVAFFPPGVYLVSNLTPKKGTTLFSGVLSRSLLANAVGPVTLQAKPGTTGYMIDSDQHAVGVIGICFNGAGVDCAAIRSKAGTQGWVIQAIFVDNFGREALYLDGLAHSVRDVAGTNLNKTTPTSRVGAVIVPASGTDHYFSECEITGDSGFPGTLNSANLYKTSFLVAGTNCMFTSCIGELGDVGFYVTGTLNKFATCRADLNHGHGWFTAGDNNVFAACGANDNSSGQAGVYDNWHVTGQGNSHAACSAVSTGTYGLPKYGYFDSAVGAQPYQHNAWHGPIPVGFTTSAFKYADSNAAGPVLPPIKGGTTSATPNVEGLTILTMDHGSPTTVTSFVGGTPGQVLRIKGNANTTIQHNGGPIFTRTGANRVLEYNKVYVFTCIDGYWFESA